MTAPGAAPPGRSSLRRLRGSLRGSLLGLVIQLISGVYLNAYVTLPLPANDAGVFPAIFTNGGAAFHAVLGILLGLGALAGLVLAWGTGDNALRLFGFLNLVAIAIAAFGGYRFVLLGDNVYSMVMALGFVLALLFELVMIARVRSLSRFSALPGTPA